MTKPTSIWYYENGSVKSELWYQSYIFHRLDRPAIIKYYKSGSIETETWCENGLHHRLDGPALIYYHENGNIERETWCMNGTELPNMPKWLKENNITAPYTKEDKMAIKLRWV